MKRYVLLSVSTLDEVGASITNETRWRYFCSIIHKLKRANRENGPLTDLGQIVQSGQLADNVWLLPRDNEVMAFEAEFMAAAKHEKLKPEVRYLVQEE